MGTSSETGRQKTEASAQASKVWTSLVTTALGTFGSLLAALIGKGLLSAEQPWTVRSPAFIATAITLVGTVAMVVGFTSLLSARERGSSQRAKLRDDVAAAYLEALEESAFNPLRGGQR